jgi:hypothetical protein
MKKTPADEIPVSLEKFPLSKADLRFILQLGAALKHLRSVMPPIIQKDFDNYLPEPLTLDYIGQRLQEISKKLPGVEIVGPV